MDEISAVKALGEQIGYGHLMELASALWRKSLEQKGYPTSGAFVTALESDVKKIRTEQYEKEKAIYDELVKDK